MAIDMGSKGGLFRFANGVDKLLMFFGTLGSIGDGLMTPLTMIVLSGVINEYGGAQLSFSNDIVDKVTKNIALSTSVALSLNSTAQSYLIVTIMSKYYAC